MYYDNSDLNKVHCTVTEDQNERTLLETKTVRNSKDNVIMEENLSGSFAKNSRNFYILEHVEGMYFGKVIIPRRRRSFIRPNVLEINCCF